MSFPTDPLGGAGIQTRVAKQDLATVLAVKQGCYDFCMSCHP
jgi:hypothetical protein